MSEELRIDKIIEERFIGKVFLDSEFIKWDDERYDPRGKTIKSVEAHHDGEDAVFYLGFYDEDDNGDFTIYANDAITLEGVK